MYKLMLSSALFVFALTFLPLAISFTSTDSLHTYTAFCRLCVCFMIKKGRRAGLSLRKVGQKDYESQGVSEFLRTVLDPSSRNIQLVRYLKEGRKLKQIAQNSSSRIITDSWDGLLQPRVP